MDRWAAIRFAIVSSGCYVAWLVTFERWLEPFLRRCAGAVISEPIVWVPTGRFFRIWGLANGRRSARDAAAALLGGVSVCGAAILPAVAIAYATIGSNNSRVAAWKHLISLTTVTLFVVRVLSGKEREGKAPASGQ